MRFVIWGDSKGKENGINKKVLNSIMNKVSNLNPSAEFLVMLGDTVAGSLTEEIFIKQLFDLKDIINKYTPEIMTLPVIGNHEVNINPYDDTFEKILCNFYSTFHPCASLENYNNSVYYIDFENVRLIVLNSFHPNEIHKIEKKQLDFMERSSKNCNKYKLVFVHSPAFPTGAHIGHCLDLFPESRDKFWNAVNKCNIDIVFSGHEHNYSRRIIQNTMQIITGGAGEKLRNKYKSKEGIIIPPRAVFHFLVVDITNSSLTVTSISNTGKVLDKFTL